MCKARRSGSRESSRESSREYRRGRLAQPATEKHNAASEDRTHDLRIMRPTRCQLRYRRQCRHPTRADLTERASTLPGAAGCGFNPPSYVAIAAAEGRQHAPPRGEAGAHTIPPPGTEPGSSA